MPLFIVVAKHSQESCPAGDPEMGKMLLSHLDNGNASKLGINIQAKVGAESQHTLHLIMDAADSQKVDEYMAPFAQMGSVEVIPGIACEAIVARGRC
jgi:hypothetical protein